METVGTAVTVLEYVMSIVAHLESVELYVTDAIKKGVDFDGIRSACCSLHYQGIEVSLGFLFLGGVSKRTRR